MLKKDPYKKDINYTAGFFMLIAFGVAGMILGGIVGGAVWTLTTGKGIEEMIQAIGNPAYLAEVQLLQTIQAICGFLLPTIVAAAFLSRGPLELVGFKEKINIHYFILVVAIMLAGLGVSSGLGYLSYQLPLPDMVKSLFTEWEKNYERQIGGMISLKTVPELIKTLFVLAVVPAVCEEVFFRGGLQNFMYRANHKMWLSVLIVSLIFSVVHLSGYGFLSRLALGIILGLVYHYTGNIWMSILAHFINNATAIIAMYVMVQQGKSMTAAMTDKSGTYLGLLALPVVILLFYRLKWRAEKTRVADGI